MASPVPGRSAVRSAGLFAFGLAAVALGVRFHPTSAGAVLLLVGTAALVLSPVFVLFG